MKRNEHTMVGQIKKQNNQYRLISLLFCLLFVAQQIFARDNSCYRDSLRQHIFDTGSAELDCYLTYSIGNSIVDPTFGNNTRELDVLHRFLLYALKDTLVCVQNVRITGYSSPDGTDSVNQRISSHRANRLLRYLNSDYHILESYSVEVLSRGADWGKLREMIAASPYKWRDDALRIIDGPGTPDWKKMQLAYLGGGDAHTRLYEEFYPRLRRVEIKIHYDVQCMKHKIRRAELPDLSNYAIRILKLQAMNCVPRKPQRMSLHPTWGIKTNLCGWAGVMSGFKMGSPTPNLSVEGFFARRWSVEAGYAYTDRDAFGGGKEHYHISTGTLEVRRWFGKPSLFRGFYLGVSGRYGEYDVQDVVTGQTGSLWGAGIGAGWFLPLSRRWGVELEARGGYRRARNELYNIEPGHYYFNSRAIEDKFTGELRLQIVYRFGKTQK